MNELLELLESKKSELNEEFYSEMKTNTIAEIRICNIEAEFNINIPKYNRSRNCDYFSMSEYASICRYGADTRRSISWSDDDKQPDDEWLYGIQFPTGAYVFHEDYPSKTFYEFFKTLKSFSPKYSDSHNHSLYFDSQHAKKVHEALPELLAAHKKIALKEVKGKEIQELKDKLEKLTNE